MQLKKANQTEAEILQDKVYACMETGNHAQARTILRELRDVDEQAWSSLHMAVVHDYGISL